MADATEQFLDVYKRKLGDSEALDGDATARLSKVFLRLVDRHEGNL